MIYCLRSLKHYSNLIQNATLLTYRLSTIACVKMDVHIHRLIYFAINVRANDGWYFPNNVRANDRSYFPINVLARMDYIFLST